MSGQFEPGRLSSRANPEVPIQHDSSRETLKNSWEAFESPCFGDQREGDSADIQTDPCITDTSVDAIMARGIERGIRFRSTNRASARVEGYVCKFSSNLWILANMDARKYDKTDPICIFASVFS